MGKYDLNGSLAAYSGNADQDTFNSHYLAVDTNILLDLAQNDSLDTLSLTDRTILLTTEVKTELQQQADSGGTLGSWANEAIIWINTNSGGQTSSGNSLIQEFDSVGQGLRSDYFATGSRDGGGEKSIAFFVQNFGSSSTSYQLNDVMVLSHDASSGSATRTGDRLIGSTHSTMDYVDLSTSLLFSGRISPQQYIDALTDFRVASTVDPRVDEWSEALFNSRRKAANVLDEFESSGSVKIPIYEADSETNVNWFNLGPGKVDNVYDQDDQIGFIEIGRDGLTRLVVGDDQVILANSQFAGVTVDPNSQLDFGIKIKKLLNGKFGLDVDVGSSYNITEVTDTLPDACFGPEVPIDMWPLDPDLKPGPDGIYDQDAIRAKVWKKPIELIQVGDLVVSFDDDGNLVPGPVTRTFQNNAKVLLNFHGTRVTPGHVYYRPDSKKSYKYETLIDVLRDDGMIQKQDGTLIRAATNVPVDSPRDRFVRAIAGRHKADGAFEQTDEGRIRLGTRFLIGTGEECKSVSVADLIECNRGVVGDDELIHVGDGPGVPFTWDFGDTLPKPEDFVLACSGTTLEDIYNAAEWESQGPRLPAPMVLDRGPVQPLKGVALSEMPRNEPLNVTHAPMAATKPQRTLNREERKAMETQQRKAAKTRKRLLG